VENTARLPRVDIRRPQSDRHQHSREIQPGYSSAISDWWTEFWKRLLEELGPDTKVLAADSPADGESSKYIKTVDEFADARWPAHHWNATLAQSHGAITQ